MISSIATALFCLSAAFSADIDRAANRFGYRGLAESPDSVTTAGETSWSARSITAAVRPIVGFGGSIGLVLDHQDNDNYYLFLWGYESTALRIYKRVAGRYTLLASTPYSLQIGREYRMCGESDEAGVLRLSINGQPLASAFDTTFRSGKVGLRVWRGGADFDDVLVRGAGGEVLLLDRFEDGNANGWSGGASWSVVQTGGTGQMPIPTVETDFEGGNVQVDFIDPSAWTIYVQPRLEGWSPYRAWYYFKLSNVSAARPTNIVIANARWHGVPYYSYDNENWQRVTSAVGNTYSQTFTGDPVWIAHSIPYLTEHKERLIEDLEGPDVRASLLTVSEAGRPVEVLTISDSTVGGAKLGVWFIARQHAWEASSSWIADGVARWAASTDPQARRLRRIATLHIVPIMDVDNVVIGGSGKDQLPIDFNRDWRDTPHWNAVREAISAIDETAASQPYAMFIDSHCPGPRADPFIYVQPQTMVSPRYWSVFLRFRDLLISTASPGPLPYTGAFIELGPSYHPLWDQISFWHQFTTHAELDLSITFETPPASAAGYRGFAQGVGRALDLFLTPAFEAEK